MQRLVSNAMRVALSNVSRRQGGHTSFRPPLHLVHSTFRPTLFFSSSTSNSEPDLSTLTNPQIEQLALQYARQANPSKAQQLLEKLPTDSPSVAILWTSIVDAWLEYQKKQLVILEEAVRHGDSTVVLRDRLEEICYAAESASELVEKELHDKKVSSHHVLMILKAWATACQATRMAGLTTSKAGDWSGIPQRAQHILTQYQLITGQKPTTESINQVLKAWAYSGEHLRGTMAEQFFAKQKDTNGETLRIMIRAWSWSNEKRDAFAANGYFLRMMRLLELGETEMEPTLEDYRILFQAWATADDKNAPSKMHTVLELVESSYRRGLTTVRPDLDCYRLALQTMSRRNVPEIGELVDQTMSEMKRERMLIPNTECYGAAILAWKHVATARECKDRERAIQRTYDLLQEMIAAFHRTTLVTIVPTTEHYNHVLEALTGSKMAKATNRAESLLRVLEQAADRATVEQLEDTEEEKSQFPTITDVPVNLVPNADTYKYALMVWRNSKAPNKVQEAQAIVDRFKDRLDLIRTVSTEKSMVDAMSAFISVCAKESSVQEGAEKMEVMFKALRTLESMKALGLTPNSTTYVALLEACDHLVQDGLDRQRILESTFVRACEEGFVDRAVLEHFKAAASTYLYSKLVVAPCREVEHMKVVPDSWTRNVQGYSAKAKGGRKVLPLTIDGRFTFTKAAADYKMRKLRKQANKRMLQGGRMK